MLKKKGITLIEIMIVIALMVLFSTLTIPYGINFYRSKVVEEITMTISNVLARAQSHALTAKEDSSWGVKFFYNENKYVFFKGDRYSERDANYDHSFSYQSGVDAEGVAEIVFEKITGRPQIFLE